jgi:hypothetical protein
VTILIGTPGDSFIFGRIEDFAPNPGGGTFPGNLFDISALIAADITPFLEALGGMYAQVHWRLNLFSTALLGNQPTFQSPTDATNLWIAEPNLQGASIGKIYGNQVSQSLPQYQFWYGYPNNGYPSPGRPPIVVPGYSPEFLLGDEELADSVWVLFQGVTPNNVIYTLNYFALVFSSEPCNPVNIVYVNGF